MKVKISLFLLVFSLSHVSYSQLSDFLLDLSLKDDWKFAIGDNTRWASVKYNDEHWEEIRVPGAWENRGFNGYDGFAWYRFTFDGSELRRGKDYWLFPGYIDDADETYFNGEIIGKSGSFPPGFRTAYKAKRQYVIPEKLINFSGKNVIAVRVFDDHLEGGIITGPVGLYTSKDYGFDIELSGIWKMKFTRDINSAQCEYDDSKWRKVMAPSPWEKQGYSHRDGTAWYRKEVILNKEEASENWVLVLGYIDDFDKTYVNGHVVGKTNDGRSYGSSRSFQTIRIYRVSSEDLQEGSNIIAIRVYDMGNVGGIYKGPMGMIQADKYDDSFKTKFYRKW